MADQFKNLMIAVFVLAALAIVAFLLIFLHPYKGNEGQIVRVRFTDIDKINDGTQVTYGGRAVGEVIQIIPLGEADEPRIRHEGSIYTYELVLRLDSGVHIYNTDDISLRTSGLLGEKTVAITPLPAQPGQKLARVNEQILYAHAVGSVEQTFKEFKEVADKFDLVLDDVHAILTDVRQKRLVDKVENILQNIEEITDALNQPDRIDEIIANVHEVSKRAVASWDTVDEVLNKFSVVGSNAIKMTEECQGIFTRLEKGEGTLGKLFSDEEFYLRMTSIMNKVEVVADDINHYGLFYHLDKGWQRLRARRMNLLMTLRTPQEFRNYFNEEIDRITTSLSRVSNLVGTTEGCYPMALIDNPCFKKVFAELLRRVEGLEESLKMYNQQLVDPLIQRTENVECCETTPGYW